MQIRDKGEDLRLLFLLSAGCAAVPAVGLSSDFCHFVLWFILFFNWFSLLYSLILFVWLTPAKKKEIGIRAKAFWVEHSPMNQAPFYVNDPSKKIRDAATKRLGRRAYL